jgi:modification methylase
VILASSNPGDVILDPFFGTGTTGAVAKRLHRNWIGIERETRYVQLAQGRIDAIQPEPYDEVTFNTRDKKRTAQKVPFITLLEVGLLVPGEVLYFKGNLEVNARVKPDGKLICDCVEGSIHQVARELVGGKPCNGWDAWHYQNEEGEFHPINTLREIVRSNRKAAEQSTKDLGQ